MSITPLVLLLNLTQVVLEAIRTQGDGQVNLTTTFLPIIQKHYSLTIASQPQGHQLGPFEFTSLKLVGQAVLLCQLNNSIGSHWSTLHNEILQHFIVLDCPITNTNASDVICQLFAMVKSLTLQLSEMRGEIYGIQAYLAEPAFVEQPISQHPPPTLDEREFPPLKVIEHTAPPSSPSLLAPVPIQKMSNMRNPTKVATGANIGHFTSALFSRATALNAAIPINKMPLMTGVLSKNTDDFVKQQIELINKCDSADQLLALVDGLVARK